ncbi:hypothetical protein B296_00020071 [Ensete ventricosum]|uniref:Uncharacterized protein n=1 Tax=Ensete ventricosum TaxID=4639 RepID=A0A426YE67_ENSVE|nr:hypothetical protein B296_00020071 [Ensete ventricosum]
MAIIAIGGQLVVRKPQWEHHMPGDEGGLDLSQETFFYSGVCLGEVSSLHRLPRDCSVIVIVPSFGVRVVL